MSVNWYWKDKMGTLVYQYGNHPPYQVNVYKGNCLSTRAKGFFKRTRK